jgi:protein TonB
VARPPETAPLPIDPVPLARETAAPKSLPTVPAPEPPPPNPAPNPDGKAALKVYARGVHASMESYKRYPIAARRLGLEGDVVIKIKIDRVGAIIGLPSVVKSCGHEVLDAEALRMVTRAAPFNPLPSAFAKDSATIKLPIRFRLKSSTG